MSKRARLAFAAIVLFQLLFLAGLAAYNEVTLRTGQVVVLQTVPVDPRDLFRGDYVVLRYEISRLDKAAVSGVYSVSAPGQTAYVLLEQQGEVWKPRAVARDAAAQWDVFIKGTVTRIGDPRTPGAFLEVEYGIENYFLPEGRGRAIETAQDIKAEVSINRFGDAVLKGLIVDGKPFTPKQ
ncbi:MAG: GDYXXLXY domain-containing protein [Chloroflexi bacterium]|nr:GDYXXLXY domain-containing protein [Chloroflexota bacterium]